MQLLFELSKEHTTLPAAEAIASMNAEELKTKIISKKVENR